MTELCTPEVVILNTTISENRRRILQSLQDESKTFLQLHSELEIPENRLNTHMDYYLKGFVKKNDKDKYELTSLGVVAIKTFRTVNEESSNIDQSLVNKAYVYQKRIFKPIGDALLFCIDLVIGIFIFCCAIFTLCYLILPFYGGIRTLLLLPILLLIYLCIAPFLKWFIDWRKIVVTAKEDLNREFEKYKDG